MSQTHQKRVPDGSSEGGQWAPRTRSEADVNLPLSDEDYNATGTFLFPPAPRSYEQFVDFWENVSVGDDILSSISVGYETWVEKEHDRRWEQHSLGWLHKNRIKKSTLGDDSYNQQLLDAEYTRWLAEFSDVHPPEIPAQDARQIARAGQMAHNSRFLPAEDAERAMEHVIQLSGGQRTVQQLNDAFVLVILRDHFAKPEALVLRKLDELSSEGVGHTLAMERSIPGYDEMYAAFFNALKDVNES